MALTEESRSLLLQTLKNLVDQIARAAEDGLRPTTIGRGYLKRDLNLYYKPNTVALKGPADHGRVAVTSGQWLRGEDFDREFFDKYFQMFLNHSPAFHKSVQVAKQISQQPKSQAPTQALTAELCLTFFSYKMLELCAMSKLDSETRDLLVTKFMKDLENNGITLSIRVGIEGLEVETPISIFENSDETLSIQPPDISDVNKSVLAIPRFNGDLDLVQSSNSTPKIPTPSAVFAIKTKSLELEYTAMLGFFEVTFYSRIKLIESIITELRLRINEARCILSMFQARPVPRFVYADLQVFLTNFFTSGPVYETRIQLENYRLDPVDYNLTATDGQKLEQFWRRMIEVKPLDRIYSRDNPSIPIREPTPLSVAYDRYLEILSSRPEPN